MKGSSNKFASNGKVSVEDTLKHQTVPLACIFDFSTHKCDKSHRLAFIHMWQIIRTCVTKSNGKMSVEHSPKDQMVPLTYIFDLSTYTYVTSRTVWHPHIWDMSCIPVWPSRFAKCRWNIRSKIKRVPLTYIFDLSSHKTWPVALFGIHTYETRHTYLCDKVEWQSFCGTCAQAWGRTTMYVFTYIYICIYIHWYGVATVNRLLQTMNLFCRI